MRLHQAPEFFKKDEKEVKIKKVRVYLRNKIVAENSVLLSSTEWLLLMTDELTQATVGGVIGDRLWIEGGCDFDSFLMSWGNLMMPLYR